MVSSPDQQPVMHVDAKWNERPERDDALWNGKASKQIEGADQLGDFADPADHSAFDTASLAASLQASPAKSEASHERGGEASSTLAPSNKDAQEPLLIDDGNRYTLFPIKYPDIFMMYKQAVASYWTVEEVDLSEDLRSWRLLKDSEKHFIKYVLAFFAASDGIVLENLAARFMADVMVPEARAFYSFQIAIENVHSEMYSLLLDHYVRDAQERDTLFNAINTIPCIKAKADWAVKWINEECCFAERLLAFACVEGIHFSASFCAVFWLKKRGLMPGLSFSNTLIARDEGLHTDFACLLYKHLKGPLERSKVLKIVNEAVQLEDEFAAQALDVQLLGMSAPQMSQYIRFVADRLLVALGYDKHYCVENPFDWMEQISLQGKANFFERRVAEYQRSGVMAGAKSGERDPSDYIFRTDVDF